MRSAVQRLDAEDEELFREVLVQLGWPASMQNRVRLVARSQSNICMQRHTRVYSSITSLPVFSRMPVNEFPLRDSLQEGSKA